MPIDEKLEHKAAADSLFEAGREDFGLGKYENARFFLALAGRLYDRVEDVFHRKMVGGWYKSTLRRLQEALPDEPLAWYNKR